ncbi:MAG: hypothetical protein DCC49_01505 [Acidobacteria bacterium]|nr:MAG: hypothetical protein DCC49_01505 [Acidobacteriota bacterium]
MAIFGIAAAALFLSIIGAAAVLGFAGFKGQDSRKSFGMYLGFVAAVFALLAVLGIITSIGMLIAQGGRDGGDVTPMGPGRRGDNSQVDDGPVQRGRQGRDGQRGPGTEAPGKNQGPNAAPGANPAGDIAGSEEVDPEEEAVLEDILGDGQGSSAPRQSVQLTSVNSSSDTSAMEQVRGGGGIMSGRNRTLIAIGSMIGSLALGGFSLLLFLWSFNLTGRKPWKKNADAGAHSAPQAQTELSSEPVTSGEYEDQI